MSIAQPHIWICFFFCLSANCCPEKSFQRGVGGFYGLRLQPQKLRSHPAPKFDCVAFVLGGVSRGAVDVVLLYSDKPNLEKRFVKFGGKATSNMGITCKYCNTCSSKSSCTPWLRLSACQQLTPPPYWTARRTQKTTAGSSQNRPSTRLSFAPPDEAERNTISSVFDVEQLTFVQLWPLLFPKHRVRQSEEKKEMSERREVSVRALSVCGCLPNKAHQCLDVCVTGGFAHVSQTHTLYCIKCVVSIKF